MTPIKSLEASNNYSEPQDTLSESIEEFINAGATVSPESRSNLIETWGHYYVQVSLPGVDLASLKVEMVGRQVTIAGRFSLPVIEGGSMRRQDIEAGEFCESFEVPGAVDGDRGEASYDRGILTVGLPKIAHLKPASIPVSLVQ